MGALSQCDCPVGIFLVDLRGKTRFAGAAGSAAAIGVGGVTLAAGTTGLADAGLPGAIEAAGGIMAVVATTLIAARSPGAVEDTDAILVAHTAGLLGAGPASALDGGGVTLAAGTTGPAGAGPPGAVEGGSSGIIAAGNVGPTGAGGCGGIAVVTSTTGLSGAAGSAGGIDGIDTFWRRARISAGSPTGGVTLTSVLGFGLGAVSLRRRFGWEAATRGAFVFPGLGAEPVASFCVGWLAVGPPSRGTPGVSIRIHFTVPLPPSVRIRLFSSRRCKSVITHRFDKPVRLASSAIWIRRLAATVDPALGAGIMRINTRYNLASAAGMTFSSHSRLISADMLAGLDQGICLSLARWSAFMGGFRKELSVRPAAIAADPSAAARRASA